MTVSRVFRAGMLCVIGGVGVGLFFSWSLGISLFLVSIAIASAIALGYPRFLNSIACVGVLLALFLGSWFRSAQAVFWWESLPDTSARLDRAIVVGRVKQTETAKQAVLQPISCEYSACPSVRVLGFFPFFADIAEGDEISLSCDLEKPEAFSAEFDYPKVLAKDGIGFVCRFPKDWKKNGEFGNMLMSGVRRTRETVEQVLNCTIPEPESGLILGLLVGGDGRLPKSIQDEFSRTGLSHIVAVSGYNVSIIVVIGMNALIFLGLYRQQALWGALLGIVFFTVLVGSPASAVRAAIMASVALLATRMGRTSSLINGILCAAAVMLLMNPLLLRYDIGFQLSFAATLGIFMVTPFALLSLRMGDIVATTLAAELFVLPIILFHFHSFPLLSLVVNLLVLPLVPLAMVLGVVAFCFGAIFPWLGVVFGFPAFLVSRAILEIIHFFASQRFASVPVSGFGMGAVLAWYGGIAMALILLRKKLSTALTV